MLIKTEQAISGASAANFKVMKPQARLRRDLTSTRMPSFEAFSAVRAIVDAPFDQVLRLQLNDDDASLSIPFLRRIPSSSCFPKSHCLVLIEQCSTFIALHK